MGHVSRWYAMLLVWQVVHTFKDDKNEADIAQRQECLLPFQGQDVADGHSIDETNNDLSDESGAKNLV